MSKPSENLSNDLYENLPCNEGVLNMHQQKMNKINIATHQQSMVNNISKHLEASSNSKECKNQYNDVKNIPKEMIYATPLRKSDRYKRNPTADSTYTEHDSSTALSHMNEKDVDSFPSQQLKNHVILNFLKDASQLRKRNGSAGIDCYKTNFSNLAKEQYFSNLVQNKVQVQVNSRLEYQLQRDVNFNENIGEHKDIELNGATPENELKCFTSRTDEITSKVYIQREWVLKKIALYLEQRNRKQIYGLSAAAGKVKLDALEYTNNFVAPRCKSSISNSSSNGCFILGSNGSGKTSVCESIINGNSGTNGILNRKLLACFFVQSQSTDCHNLFEFIRKVVLQILSHSTLLNEDSSQKVTDEGFGFLQDDTREQELKLDEVINNISLDRNTEDFLIDELKRDSNECEIFELYNCLEKNTNNSVLKRQMSTPAPQKWNLNEEEINEKNYDTHPPKARGSNERDNELDFKECSDCDAININGETKSKLPSVPKYSPNKKSKIPVKLKKAYAAVPSAEKIDLHELKNSTKAEMLSEENGSQFGEKSQYISGDISKKKMFKNHILNQSKDYGNFTEASEDIQVGSKKDELIIRIKTEENRLIDNELQSVSKLSDLYLGDRIKNTTTQLTKRKMSPHPLPKVKCCRTKMADTYYKLLLKKPEIFNYLSLENIKKDPDECFKKALLFPLLEITPPKSALLLLVDSIDENYSNESSLMSTLKKRRNSATPHQQSRNIAELLSNHIHLFPKWLFLVCTTKKQMKPITKIFAGFKKLTLDDLRKSHVVKDVQEYIIKRLNTDFKDSIMLTKEIIESLHQLYIKSNGCILYLEKVLNGIKENFFNFGEIKLIPCTLNGLYLYICQKSFNKKQFVKVRPILNILLASSGYLEKSFILNCLKTHNYVIEKEDFEKRLQMMRSILCYDEGETRLKIFHTSFCDWLVDIKFATKKFVCDINEGHTLICMYYLLVAETLCANTVRKFIFHFSKCSEYLLNCNINLDMALLILESRINFSDCLYTNQLKCCQECKMEFMNDFDCLPKTKIMVEKFVNNQLSDELSQIFLEFFKPSLPLESNTVKVLAGWGISNFNTQHVCESLLKSPDELVNINIELENLLLSNEQLCSRLSSSPPSKESTVPNEMRESKILSTPFQLPVANHFELIKGKAFIHLLANDGNHYLLERALNICTGLIDLEIEDCNGQTALNIAARNGHLEIVKLLLNFKNKSCKGLTSQINRIDVNHADKEGWTPLRSASWGGHTEVVKLLISYPNCKIDLADKEGRTALRAAAWSGHEDILKMLIENGASVNSVDRQGRTSLIAASYMGHYDIVEILLKNGAHVNHLDLDGRSALCVAALCCSAGYSKVISTLLEHGANTDQLDNDGMSPLLVSSFEGNADICELLLENTADPDLSDFMGRTPLWAACTAGHSHVVKLLLFWGCRIDCMDSEGRTVLSIAAAQGNIETVGQLLDRGLDETHRDNAGWTPLHYASFEGFHDVCVQLLDAGAKIDERDNEGKTALHLAAQEDRTNCAQVLLETLPTLIDQKSIDGKTAFRLACLEGHFDMIQYLLKSHCDVNSKDADSRTTLYVLSLENKLVVVKYLLEHTDVDVNAPDSEGRTALHVAAWQGHTDMVQMLLTLGNANVNAKDVEIRTPLHSCAWQGNCDTMNILLSFGALPDHSCKQGATALGISAQEGHEECVIALLKYGANPFKSDHCGRTPIKLAAKSHRTNILKIFDNYQHISGDSNSVLDEKCNYTIMARTPEQPISLPVHDNISGGVESTFSPSSSAFSVRSSLSNNFLTSNKVAALNSTSTFNNFYQNTMQSDTRSSNKRKSVIFNHSSGSANDLENKLITSELQYTQNISITKVNAETVTHGSPSNTHQIPEAVYNSNEHRIVNNDADFYDMECMSPMYATPPHSPNSEVSSSDQPRSILDINNYADFAKSVPLNNDKCIKSVPKSAFSDSHFARDTHMHIILGNLKGKQPGSSSKITRNCVTNNSAMRLIRSRFDSAAQLIRRTNNVLSGNSQDSSSIGVKSSTFQWRKESQI